MEHKFNTTEEFEKGFHLIPRGQGNIICCSDEVFEYIKVHGFDVIETTDKTVAMASMRKAMPEFNLVLEEENNGKTRDN